MFGKGGSACQEGHIMEVDERGYQKQLDHVLGVGCGIGSLPAVWLSDAVLGRDESQMGLY